MSRSNEGSETTVARTWLANVETEQAVMTLQTRKVAVKLAVPENLYGHRPSYLGVPQRGLLHIPTTSAIIRHNQNTE
jgi:hypothetical protein